MTETPNLTYISQLSKGNKLFEKSLMDIIRRELPQEIDAYRLHLSNSDYNETAGCVHKINHKFKILSLREGFKTAHN